MLASICLNAKKAVLRARQNSHTTVRRALALYGIDKIVSYIRQNLDSIVSTDPLASLDISGQ